MVPNEKAAIADFIDSLDKVKTALESIPGYDRSIAAVDVLLDTLMSDLFAKVKVEAAQDWDATVAQFAEALKRGLPKG